MLIWLTVFNESYAHREVAALQEENCHLKRLLAGNTSRTSTPHNHRNSPGATPVKRGQDDSRTFLHVLNCILSEQNVLTSSQLCTPWQSL